MYNDEVANRHYLVRYDVILGATDQRDGNTVLAKRLDSFNSSSSTRAGTELDVATIPGAHTKHFCKQLFFAFGTNQVQHTI
jgi:hypothetical protein